MHQLPIIRDSEGDLSGDCHKGSGAPVKELHKVHRTLPSPSSSSNSQDMLQDEAGFPFIDDETGGFIFDDLRE